jgi:hypothetical protein
MRKLGIAVGCIVFTFCALTHAADEEEYYTWVDENGITNYAERNPQGYNARFVTGDEQRFGYNARRGAEEFEPTPSVENNANNAAPEEDQDQDQDQDIDIAAERERIDNEIAAAKKSNCNIGKRNLAQLESYDRIKVKDDDGSVRILSNEEKEKKVSAAKTTIRENCSG